jgi:hypothetical protein
MVSLLPQDRSQCFSATAPFGDTLIVYDLFEENDKNRIDKFV